MLPDRVVLNESFSSNYGFLHFRPFLGVCIKRCFGSPSRTPLGVLGCFWGVKKSSFLRVMKMHDFGKVSKKVVFGPQKEGYAGVY